jgi:hypothetical protein
VVALANLLVQVRTAGANQLRNLAGGFRQASRAGQRASAQMRGDFDRAVLAMNRANGELAEMRREFNRAPSQETARALHLAALRARQASQNVDNLADQLRQANRAATSLAGRMAAVAAAAAAIGADAPVRTKMLAGLVAGLAALAPALGAALQGAILIGLGGVGLGAAIVAAFQDLDIRQAWADMLSGIGDDLKQFGRQLGPALTQSATMFRLAWGRAADGVRHLFGDLGTAIVPLTQGLIGLIREAGPGMKQAFAVAVPVLKELAAMLPGLGKAIGDFFDSLSESKAGALKGTRVLVMALAGSLMILGNTIEFLSGWFDFWTKAAEKVYSALGKIPLLGRPFKELAEVLNGINEPVDDLQSSLVPMAGSTLAVAQASRDAARAMQDLHAQMTAMISNTLNADQAMLAWASAIRAVSESVKENGRSLDINTEKGHANVSAILAAVQAAEQKRQADIALAGGENAAASAVAAANAKFQQQLGELAALMRQLGFTQAQIDAVLGKYRELAAAPNINKTVTVTYRSVGDARAAGVAGGNIVTSKDTRIFGYASGTPKAPPGWAWVGEKGPELVNFRGGEQVLDAKTSARMAAGGSPRPGRGGTTLVYQGGPKSGLETMFFRWLQESIRDGKLKLA